MTNSSPESDIENLQSTEVQRIQQRTPEIVSDLDKIEKLVDSGIRPWDLARYSKSGEFSESGINNQESLDLTLAAQRLNVAGLSTEIIVHNAQKLVESEKKLVAGVELDPEERALLLKTMSFEIATHSSDGLEFAQALQRYDKFARQNPDAKEIIVHSLFLGGEASRGKITMFSDESLKSLVQSESLISRKDILKLAIDSGITSIKSQEGWGRAGMNEIFTAEDIEQCTESIQDKISELLCEPEDKHFALRADRLMAFAKSVDTEKMESVITIDYIADLAKKMSDSDAIRSPKIVAYALSLTNGMQIPLPGRRVIYREIGTEIAKGDGYVKRPKWDFDERFGEFDLPPNHELVWEAIIEGVHGKSIEEVDKKQLKLTYELLGIRSFISKELAKSESGFRNKLSIALNGKETRDSRRGEYDFFNNEEYILAAISNPEGLKDMSDKLKEQPGFSRALKHYTGGEVAQYVLHATDKDKALEEMHQKFTENTEIFDEIVENLPPYLAREVIDRLILSKDENYKDKLSEIFSVYGNLIGEMKLPENELSEFREIILTRAFDIEGGEEFLAEVAQIYSSDAPDWQKRYYLAQLQFDKVFESQEAATLNYDVTLVPRIDTLPSEQPGALGIIQLSQLEKTEFSSLSVLEKRNMAVDGLYLLDDSTVEQLKGIPFNMLKPDLKKIVFATSLRESFEQSHNEEVRAERSQKNADSPHTFVLGENDFIHSAPSFVLEKILQNGNLCGEALGEKGGLDRTRLSVDLVDIPRYGKLTGRDATDRIRQSFASAYGDLCFVIEPAEPDKTRRGGPYSSFGQALEIGAVASTRLKAILLQRGTAEVSFEGLKRAIARNGMYVPIYSESGELKFSYDDFQGIRAEINQSGDYKLQRLNESLRLVGNTSTPSEFVSREIVRVLSQDSDLDRLFEADSGVKEGYTIREHSEAAIYNFNTNFAESYSSSLLSREKFALMLALHDIGKSESVAHLGTTHYQHGYTENVIDQKAELLGLTAEESALMQVIVCHDYIGDFVRHGRSLDELVVQAEKLGVDPNALAELMIVYYSCDSGSYTSYSKFSGFNGLNETPKGSLNDLFVPTASGFEFKSEIQAKLGTIQSAIIQSQATLKSHPRHRELIRQGIAA